MQPKNSRISSKNSPWLRVIAALGGSDAELRLEYLEEHLHLIQKVGPDRDSIRFAIDPLAEYLAALYLVNKYGSDQQLWQEFLEQNPSLEGVIGNHRRILECCARLLSGKRTGG